MAKISKKKLKKMKEYELRMLHGRLAEELGKEKVNNEEIAYIMGHIDLWSHIGTIFKLEES